MAKRPRYCENQHCNKPLRHAMRLDARFCCAACRAKRHRWVTVGRERMLERFGKKRSCPECHGPLVIGLDLRRSDALYCSLKCRVVAYRRKQRLRTRRKAVPTKER